MTPGLADVLLDAGNKAWPNIVVSRGDLSTLLEGLGHQSAGVTHPADLYLACACLLHHPVAVTVLDKELLAQIPQRILKIVEDRDIAEEIEQRVREQLLWSPTGHGKLASYAGRGDLAGWIGVTATRLAVRVRRGTQCFEDEATLADAPSADPDPERRLIRERTRKLFDDALKASMLAVPPETRALLKAYFLERRTLAEIAAESGVNPTTIWRRLEAARRDVFRDVRRRLVEGLGPRGPSFDSIAGVVFSELDLRVSALFSARE